MTSFSVFWRITSLIAGLVLAPAVAAQPVTDGTEERIRTFLTEVEQDLAALDRSGFDPAELLDRLDYDAERIVAFIDKEIAFEPYAGVLRGAAGTLMSRAGNSFDTAILLATLLGDAGYDVRIARGILNAADARRLLSTISAEEAGPDVTDIGGSTLFRFAADESDALIEELAEAGLSLPAPHLPGSIIEETRDYAWVEYRLGAMEEWRSVHPLMAEAPDVGASGHFVQTIPEDLLHTVGISLMLERRVGDEVERERIAGPYIRPAANLNGQLIEVFIHPNTFDLDTPGHGTLENLRRAGIFVPVIAGEVSRIAFDLHGSTIDTDALALDAFGAGAVFQNVGEASRDAADALAAMGSDISEADSVLALNGLWLEIIIGRPGGRERVWRRDFLEPLPDTLTADDARLLRAAQITAHHGLMVSSSDLPESYAENRALRRLEETAPLWPAFLSSVDGMARDVAVRDWPGTSPLPHLGTFRLMEQGAAALGGLRSYRPDPAVLIVRQALRSTRSGQHAIDIVANPRRSWVDGPEGPLLDPERVLRAGVWETGAEGHYEPQSSAERSVLNTFAVFRAARAEGAELTLAERPRNAGEMGLDPVAERAIGQDLEAGYAALLPAAKPDEVAMTGWWRVNPVTGETLGMLADGRGTEATEYLIDNTLLAYNLITAIKGYTDCDQYGDVESETCCLVEAHLNNVGGLGMGGVLGATYGKSTVRMCDVGKIVHDAIKPPKPGSNAYECKIFAPGFDPDSLTGPGGVYDPQLLGCAGLKQPAP